MIVVAAGRGGEMTEFSPDLPPHETDITTAADVALLRLPVAPVVLGGYHRQSTDEVLNLVARTVTERDVEIATLRRQIAYLQSAQDAPSARPADPPAYPQPWSAWEPSAPAQRPDADDPANPEQTG